MFSQVSQVTKQADLLAIVGAYTTLTEHKGQHDGDCPFCGGKRFVVWPDKGKWKCFKASGATSCAQGGNASWFLKLIAERDGVDRRQLCERYGIDAGYTSRKAGQSKPKPAPLPVRILREPGIDWQSKAWRWVEKCEQSLWAAKPAGPWALGELRTKRGLSDDTIRFFRLGWSENRGDFEGLGAPHGFVMPWIHGQRIDYVNVRQTAGASKCICLPGAHPAMFGNLTGKATCFVTEGELDAACLWERVHDFADVLTLGSSANTMPASWLAALLPVKRFVIATDNDADGETAAQHWLQIVGDRGERVYVPSGKDACEAWSAGVDLRAWALGIVNPGPSVPAVAESAERIAGASWADHDHVAPWEDAPALPDVINLTEWAHGAHPGVQIGEPVGATGKPWIGGKAYAVFSRATT